MPREDAARQPDVDLLIGAAGEGDRAALERMLPLVYSELRALARQRLSGERPDHTLHATDLVHEAYLKLVAPATTAAGAPKWNDRAHFFAIASRVMRNVLVDHARARQSGVRDGDAVRVTLSEVDAAGLSSEPVWEVEQLDGALVELAQLDARAAAIVEMRYFGGLTIDEVGTALGISPATVKRDWTYAIAWLKRALAG